MDNAWEEHSGESERRMGTGGLLLEALDGAERRKSNIDDGKMALLVKHVGQFGAHGVAKRAGFKKGDILVAFHGRDDLNSETALLAHAMQHTKPGQQIPVTVVRGAARIDLQLKMQ